MPMLLSRTESEKVKVTKFETQDAKLTVWLLDTSVATLIQQVQKGNRSATKLSQKQTVNLVGVAGMALEMESTALSSTERLSSSIVTIFGQIPPETMKEALEQYPIAAETRS